MIGMDRLHSDLSHLFLQLPYHGDGKRNAINEPKGAHCTGSQGSKWTTIRAIVCDIVIIARWHDGMMLCVVYTQWLAVVRSMLVLIVLTVYVGMAQKCNLVDTTPSVLQKESSMPTKRNSLAHIR